METKFKSNVNWLKGSIIQTNYNFGNETLSIYYRNNDENLYGEVKVGKDFKPFIYLTNGKEKKFNVIKHTDHYSNIQAWKQKAGKDGYFLLSPETQFLIQSKRNFFENSFLKANGVPS